MKDSNRVGKTLKVACLLIVLLGLTGSKNEPELSAETKRIMAAIYISMQELLPVSFDEQAFRSKENEPKIKAFLKSLADNGEALSLHGSKREQGFKFLSETFESDVKQTYQWFVQGDTEGARFYLHNIIDDCVACHSKLPTESAKMGTDGLFKQMAIERLAPLEKARLYVAMRQFDEAMTTYEDHFLDLVKKGDAAMALDAFGDYLKIAIRVKGDLKRPLVTLDKVRSEDKLPEFLVRLTAAWQEDLKLLEKQKIFNKIEISEANRLIEYGKKRMIFARDRIGVVPYTAASAILHRVVDQKDLDSKKISEAYYLLGVSESLIARSFWVSQSKTFFETAIRAAPQSEFAPKAYALLEEQAYLEFTGSSGVNIPDDLKAWLRELRTLIKTKAK